MPTPARKTDFDWQAECSYISRTTTKQGRVPEMNKDRAVFLRYCEMQRAAAERDGQHDAAEYIQHCIDNLKGEAA